MSEKGSYEALMDWLHAIRDARKESGLTVDTVEWLTEVYEGRGHSHRHAVQMANGEDSPCDPECDR